MRSTSRSLRLAGLLSAALLIPSSLAADDAPPAPAAKPSAPPVSPEEAYAARLRTAMPQIAAGFERAASFALRSKLRQSGLNVYAQMKAFDPGNEKANRELGFVKKGTEWVPDEAKRKKADEAVDESAAKQGEFNKLLHDGQVAAGRVLAELGDLAEKAGMAAEAKAHWKQALLQDDQNAVANQKAGNRLVEGKWVTDRAIHFREFQKVYRETLAKAQKMAVTPVTAEENTGIADKAGIKMTRLKTKNFRIESSLPDGDIRNVLTWLERAREFYLRLFDVPDRLLDYERDPMVYVIGISDAQKDSLIDACAEIPADQKAFKKKFGVVTVTRKLEVAGIANGASAERNCVHTATHSFVGDSLGQHAPWLKEALANAVSAAVRESDLKVCFSGDGSTGGITLASITLKDVPPLLREKVRTGKDTPLGDFVKLPSDALTSLQIAKSWSVVMYLLERDRARAREYFAGAGQGNGGDRSKDDRVLKEYYEEYPTWGDLDGAWRDWALDVYK